MCDLLRREILESGDGLKLPSEDALIRSFAVSRNTVREALDLLRQEGLLERVPGAGTFSSDGAPRHRFDLAQGFGQGILSSEALERELLVLETRPAPPPVTRALEIPPGSEAVLLERIVRLDGSPLYHATTWLPAFIAGDLAAGDLQAELTELIQSLGFEIGPTEFSLDAVRAGAADAETLAVPEGAPLILFGTRTRLADGRVVEFSFARMRAHRFEIVPGLVPLATLTADATLPDPGTAH